MLALRDVFSSARNDPVSNGKHLSAWVKDLNEPPAIGSESAKAIRQLGTNALPYLLEELSNHDTGLRKRIMDWAADDGNNFQKFWWTYSDEGRAVRAQNAMITLGPIAKPALGELVRRLNDPSSPYTVATVLGHIGPEALNPLLNALTNSSSEVREKAAGGLGWMGTNAQPAIPKLLTTLHDPVWHVRVGSAFALGKIGCEPEIVIPELIASLSDMGPQQYGRVRGEAAFGLGLFGSRASAAVPDLIKALSDPESNVRRSAGDALKKIDPAAAASAGVK